MRPTMHPTRAWALPLAGLAGLLAGAAPLGAAEIALDDVRITEGSYEAVADHVPWSGAWWPFAQGKLAKGFHGESDFTYDPETEEFTPVDKPADELSPLRKYDLFVKRRFGTDPESAYLELKGDPDIGFHHHIHGARQEQLDEDGVSYGWWGHCNGWAAAACMEREPIAPVTIEGIRFDVADLKGLLSETYWSVRSDFTGRRYNDPSPELEAKVELGRELLEALDGDGDDDEPEPLEAYIDWYEDIFSTTIAESVRPHLTPENFRSSLEHVRDWAYENWEEAYNDLHPHTFHKLIVSTIENRGQAIVFDIDPGAEVWNFPAYWFRTDIREREERANGETVFDVTTELHYAHDGVSESILGVNPLPRTYSYTLVCDADGRPIGGEWSEETFGSHPDFAWVPTYNPRGVDTGENPRLIFGKLLEVLSADHEPGPPAIELLAGTPDGGFVRRSQHVAPAETTTWETPVAVESPVPVRVEPAAGHAVAIVRYHEQRTIETHRYVTAALDGLTQLAEVEGEAPFEASLALEPGKRMVVAEAFDASGRLIAATEITLDVLPGGATPPPATGDPFEPNDTRAAAAAIAPGVYAGLFTHNDDWYRVEVPAGGALEVEIRFSHADGDLDLEVHGPDGLLGRSQGTGDSERVRRTDLPAGAYDIRVYGYQGAAAHYAMTVTVEERPDITPPAPSDPFANNHSRADAALVTPGTYQVAVRENDRWYAVELATGETARFLVTFRHADGDIDIQAFDPSGALLGTSQGTTDSEVLTVTAQAAGLHYLRIYGYAGAQNDCELEVTVTAAAPAPDPTPAPGGGAALAPGATRAEAAALAPGTYDGLRVEGDDHWFALALAADAEVTVTIRFAHAHGDLDMALHAEDGARLALSQGVTDEETFSYRAPSDRTVYLRVYGYAGARNTYDLELR